MAKDPPTHIARHHSQKFSWSCSVAEAVATDPCHWAYEFGIGDALVTLTGASGWPAGLADLRGLGLARSRYFYFKTGLDLSARVQEVKNRIFSTKLIGYMLSKFKFIRSTLARVQLYLRGYDTIAPRREPL
eukprot:SAG31_NODE_2775_length_5105_cov_4.744706_4_plen_131_part_00